MNESTNGRIDMTIHYFFVFAFLLVPLSFSSFYDEVSKSVAKDS